MFHQDDLGCVLPAFGYLSFPACVRLLSNSKRAVDLLPNERSARILYIERHDEDRNAYC